MTDEKAMVVAHQAGKQLYWDEAGKKITPAMTITRLATVSYPTVDERIAFVSGYFGEKRRTAKLKGVTDEPK